jgi:multicomponent Na+:H+ antiporter subunit F
VAVADGEFYGGECAGGLGGGGAVAGGDAGAAELDRVGAGVGADVAGDSPSLWGSGGNDGEPPYSGENSGAGGGSRPHPGADFFGYIFNYLYAENDCVELSRTGGVCGASFIPASGQSFRGARILMLTVVLWGMIGAFLIPIYQMTRRGDIWETMLALSSVATKSSLIMLLVAVMRDDGMMGLVGVITLAVGNAGFMLLAHLLRRMGQTGR